MNTQTITLDVSKHPAVTPVLYLGQGDKSGTTLRAEIYDGGAALSLTGYSVKLCIRTPNGAGYYEKTGTVSGNVATFAIDETYAASVAGVTDAAYVEVISGTTVICSTNRFRVVVLPNATEGADPSGAYTNGVQKFLSDADASLRTLENQAEAEIERQIARVDDAVGDLEETTERAESAIDAMGDISELAIPLMTADVRGGAKQGAGLHVEDGALRASTYLETRVSGTDTYQVLVAD